MSSSKEDLKGLPEIYLSPSRSSISSGHGGLPPSDTELNVLDDTDSEVWTTLVPEMTATDGIQLSAVSSEGDSPELSLGQREEIEGVSSIDSPLNSNNFSSNRSQTFYLPREPEGSRTFSTADPSQSTDAASRQNVVEANSDGHWKHQRGETPGSDCPPTVGIGALSRVFRQPLDLNINNALSSKNELIFSPGGDEGFMVPGGVCAYYGTGSGSDTDWLDWNSADDGAAQALSPSRDVEGADSTTASAQVYAGNAPPTRTGLENMERNSPAGLSTPDAEVDLRYRAGGRRVTASQAKTKSNIRPPVVGQSEENALTATRKDLGSTDGEESEDDGGQKRLTLLRDNILSDIQLSSLGSQSENTDSVNTVLDMSRGEVQGCETDSTGDTLLLSPSQVLETGSLQHNPKPTFVVGGLIAPRGKHKVFQNTIRGRMLDMMASLELEPNLEAKVFVDRDHFLSQPPLGPQVSTVSEQETSLASMVSVESTNHPESSDRVTSPSVLSVSSAASSKRLEWDSGADVGYAGNTPEQITSSLSTLERIALGSYASVLRTEPEGTTHVADKQKPTRKSAKGMSVKSAGTVSHSKRSNQEKPTASSISKSHRGQHSKERYKMSSSEEERFSSPANSPRRRPRKRPTASNSRKLDLPVKSSAGKTKKTFGRLHEILQELNSEGKASSLVELNQTSRPASEYRRSNSQQSLLYSGDTSDKQTGTVVSMSAAVGSSTSVVTAVCCRAKPESSSASGNAISTAEASSKLKLESKSNKAWESKKSQQSLNLQKITAVTRNQEKVFLSSSNEVSSKSRGSSDNETLSDVKDTEGDSCPSSNLVSDEEPVNLKARKNSENARNHENITKLNLRSSGSKSDQCRAQKKNEDSSSSSSLQRSFLESQVSIQSSNNSLQALSVRLREKIQALLDSGTVKKVQDYNKLQDYVAFIGMPSTSEEECQLKHGVASVIMRMFGEIEDDTDASNLTSETSDPVTPSSPSDYKAENMSVNTLCSHDDVDISPGVDTLKKEESGLVSVCPSSQVPLSTENGAGNSNRIVSTASKGGVTSSEGSRSVTPSDTVKLVPYRPPSATRTYFMAVSCNLEEGMVEGERVTTPEGVVLSPRGSNDQQDDLRGQAEGQRELVTDDSELSSPTAYQRESRMKDVEEVHEGECYNMSEGETSISVVLTARQDDLRGQAEGQRDIIRDDSEQSSPTAYRSDARIEDHRQPSEENDKVIPVKDSEDEESVSVSGATALPQEWSNVMNSQMRSNILPGSVTSDESSPRHVWPSTWDRQSKWHEDEKETRSEEAIGWKYATTRSESLYKDKLGTLHVAKQPPGYADDRDSHQSESLSDHEPHQLCANDTESQEDRRPYGHPWTSSGSESAYETIRERHRHVDEALASSFEFYSTSPRDARLLGYISSEAEKDKEEEVDCEMEDQLDEEQISELSPLKSELQPVEEYSAQKSSKSKTHSSDKNDGSRDSTRFISSFSSHTDEDLSSSQISFIKLQKHRYVRRIQHYIDSLEKLERVLVAQFGDSIGSEKSFQRYVTEGRSHTESDSNKTQTRDILGTGSSSIASSDLSDDGIHRKVPLPRWRRKGVLSRSNAHSESHDIPAILTRRSEEGAGGPLQQSSLVSSPRISISHRSSDIVSSRTSTLKQIEKEVRMLALAEEKSRHAIRKSGKPKSSGSRKMGRYDVQRMQREEPRGEEDPVRSLVSSRRGTLDSNLSSKFCAPDHVPSPKRPTKKKERVPKAADASQVSEEEISSQSISDSQISRRGDGRETGDAKQQLTSQAAVTAYGTRTSYKQSSVVNSSSNRDNPPSKSNSVQTSRLDFGQMFPSTECLRPNSFLYAHSVGIQTGTSLLCLDDRENECRGKFSSITSSFSQKNKKQRDSCVSIVQEKEIATIQEPHSTGGGDSHDQSSSESAVLGFTDRNIPTGSSFDGQENGRLQSYEEGKTKEKRSEYSDRTEITTAKNLEAEGNQEVSQKMTQSFQPSNVQHTAEISGSRSMKVPKLITTSRRTEQNLIEPNVLYSVPCSGRTAMISKEKASAGQGTSKEALSGYSSEEWRESVCEVQNEVSDSDCNRNEYGVAKIGPAGSNFKTPEKSVTETTNSSSPAQVYSENNRSSSLAKRNRHANEESSSLQQLCDSVQIPEGDLDHDARRYRGGQDQLPGAVHQQHELQETMLPQSPQNNRYIHVKQVDQSSGVSQTYGNEGDVVRNPKNCLVVINDNQLIPSKNTIESISELGLAHVGSYAGRGLEHSTKRSIDSGQISAHAASKKAPVTFEVNVNDKENVYKEVLKSKVSSHQETRLCIDTTKHITLQEALLKARPDYVREAGERRALIRLKQELRQVAQSRNHDIISQIPTNLQTPSTLQRFLYKPDIAPLFSYRDIREQNRRLYQLLPEANMNQMRSQCTAKDRTNRLIAKMYSQKLRNKVLKGQVSHAHKDIVSTTPAQRK